MSTARFRRKGITGFFLRLLLGILSLIYGVLQGLHRGLYLVGILRVHKLPYPCISVGNITCGGTGKTPMISFLANWFSKRNLRVAILSRGFGKIKGKDIDDENILQTENVRRFTGANRIKIARKFLPEFNPDIVLLDDGFQHYKIHRDLNIVMVDALNPFSNNHLLPRGLLREKPASLNRAHVIVLTHTDQVDNYRLETIKEKIKKVAPAVTTIIESIHEPVSFESIGIKKIYPLIWCTNRDILAFCGIGNPESFKLTLLSLGANITSFSSFEDHYNYSRQDVERLKLKAKEYMVDSLVTTQKDALRLSSENFELPVYYLKIELKISRGMEALEKRLTSLIGQKRQPREPRLTRTSNGSP